MTLINPETLTDPKAAPTDRLPYALGVVVIGRNEGERLPLALQSVLGRGYPVVYVDSGSTDGSVAVAHSLGADVVELDAARPFTAARARNAGLTRLLERSPELDFVQFVDGDCEVAPLWLQRGAAELQGQPDIAAVCGLLRERNPKASIYNRLCDMEWNSGTGEILACGGIAMFQVSAFRETGGFIPSIPAGEEPELCLRLRRRGWRIVRIPYEMACHDAAMMRFGRWWKRSVRSGYACAIGAALHGRAPERHKVRQIQSALAWGIGAPVAMLAAVIASVWTPWAWVWFVLVIGSYAVLFSRIWRQRARGGDGTADAALYAFFCICSKWAECLGIARYLWARSTRSPLVVIEHKGGALHRTSNDSGS